MLLSVAGFVGALPAAEVTGPVSRTISLEDFRDRMQGAWIGQSVGVAYGWPTEFICKGSIIPDEKMPVWKPESINETFSQDDLYMEMTFIMNYGDGLYAGQFVGAMYAEAYFVTDCGGARADSISSMCQTRRTE